MKYLLVSTPFLDKEAIQDHTNYKTRFTSKMIYIQVKTICNLAVKLHAVEKTLRTHEAIWKCT